MRRRIPPEPVSRAAVWSRRLALLALLVAGASILLAHGRRADPRAALTIFAAALIVAGVAIVLAVAAASVIWRDGCRGAGQAFVGFLLAAGLLAYPAWLAALALMLPAINDVSTDLVAPPSFLHTARTRAAGVGADPPAPAEELRAAQETAYPDLQTIKVEMGVLDAYRLALAVATDLGWRILDLQPPGPGGGAAAIEALDRSRFFGFPSDIVIRVKPGATSTAIDVRTASQFSGHDFGANAKRVRAFTAAIKQASLDR